MASFTCSAVCNSARKRQSGDSTRYQLFGAKWATWGHLERDTTSFSMVLISWSSVAMERGKRKNVQLSTNKWRAPSKIRSWLLILITQSCSWFLLIFVRHFLESINCALLENHFISFRRKNFKFWIFDSLQLMSSYLKGVGRDSLSLIGHLTYYHEV